MFRKWLVAALASAFLCVGFLGCEDGTQTPKQEKTTKPKTEVKPGTPGKVETPKPAPKTETGKPEAPKTGTKTP